MDLIPAFPLSIVAFPGESIKLHIFESRYKHLFGEIKERNLTFALVPYYEDKKVSVGTEMELVKIIEKYPDGKLDVEVKGINPLKIHELHSRYPNRLYPGSEITRLPWSDDMERLANPNLLESIKKLYAVMKIANVTINDPSLFRTYQVAHKVGFSIQQELEFLTIEKEEMRQKFMLSHISNLLPMAEEMETLRQRAALNGHIKNLKSPF